MDIKMVNGIVKWFNDQKGYGFVASEGKDYFIHYKDINKPGFKSLKEGEKVLFEPAITPKGPVATLLSTVP